MIPAAGNVRLMFMADEQGKKSYTVIEPNYKQGSRELDAEIPKQVDFGE